LGETNGFWGIYPNFKHPYYHVVGKIALWLLGSPVLDDVDTQRWFPAPSIHEAHVG
jgi:hypothetical protein